MSTKGITAVVTMLMGKPKEIGHLCNTSVDGKIIIKSLKEEVLLCGPN